MRVALGAAPAGILSMVLGRTMHLLLAGLVPGLAAALLLERTIRAFLFDARPHEPAIYAGVTLVLLVAGFTVFAILSIFNGTHYGAPRTWTTRLKVSF